MTKKKTPPLNILSLGNLLDMDIPARRPLLTPWLREGESAMMFAAPGVGKSMLSLTLALAVAGGGEALGWSAPEPRRVMYVDGEMALRDVQDRTNLLIPTVAGMNMTAARENLTLLARQNQSPAADFPDLAEPDGRAALLGMAQTRAIDLIVLDNLSTLATIEDENSASSFNDTTKFLLTLKQVGIACVLVHHSGKSGADYRGSSKLATTFDAILGLRRTDTAAGRFATAFEIEWVKLRHKRDASTQGKAVWLEEEGGAARWAHEVSESDKLAQMVLALRSCEFRSGALLAKHLGVDPASVSRWKNNAIRLGMTDQAEWRRCLDAGADEKFGEDY
jgi:RecA-family ATPase